MSEIAVFWGLCAIVAFLAGRFRAFRRETDEQIEWLWERLTRLEQRVEAIEQEGGR